MSTFQPVLGTSGFSVNNENAFCIDFHQDFDWGYVGKIPKIGFFLVVLSWRELFILN